MPLTIQLRMLHACLSAPVALPCFAWLCLQLHVAMISVHNPGLLMLRHQADDRHHKRATRCTANRVMCSSRCWARSSSTMLCVLSHDCGAPQAAFKTTRPATFDFLSRTRRLCALKRVLKRQSSTNCRLVCAEQSVIARTCRSLRLKLSLQLPHALQVSQPAPAIRALRSPVQCASRRLYQGTSGH